MSNLEEFIQAVRGSFDNGANAVLIYNDAFEVIRVSELLSQEFNLKNAEEKLLDIRVFDQKKEIRICRDYAGNTFSEKIELDDEEMQEYDTYEDEQYLDKAKVFWEAGKTWIRATGGGSYPFPTDEKSNSKVKLKNYVSYDEYGQACLAAWRLVAFIKE